ncbi:MAG: GNAT family protein [Pseudomonadota bacterium]
MLNLLKRMPSDQPGPVLTGDRVLLRPARMEDWSSWAEVRRVSRTFLEPWEPTWASDSLTQQAFRRRVRILQRERLAGTSSGLLMFDREGGQVIGGLTIADIRRGVAMTCSIGYWVGEPYARQGYMSEGVAVVLEHIFDTLRLHRVEAACLPDNEASQRLLRRLGFHEEGLARGYLKIDGRWQDHRLFALLESDWRHFRLQQHQHRAAALAGD